jgi:lipooligosaccharide transport system permease protein
MTETTAHDVAGGPTALVSADRALRRRARPVWWRCYCFWAFQYRRTWRGSVVVSFVSPLLYLAAVGVGLGSLVDRHSPGGLYGYSYLDFLAPGLMAATVMQIGFNDALYPVLSAFKWGQQYLAALATPASSTELLVGHVAWLTTRLALISTTFFLAMLAFGVVHSPEALVAIPAGICTGLAFVTPTVAFIATQEGDQALSPIYRTIVIPLFLFSGAFFPIAELPGWFQSVVRVSPLYQGVAICQESVLFGIHAPLETLAHFAYLLVLSAAGLFLARITYRRRLVV